MEELLSVDDVAYVRFASVYRSFATLDRFEKELKKIKKLHN
jgi:transcriptional regulator NrdR family protein